MHYELYISPSALKELKKLDSNERESIKTKLKLLALDPVNTSIDITQIKGKHQPIYYRIKSGDYRVIYYIEEEGIYVDKIGHRKNIYRGLNMERGVSNRVGGLKLSR